MKTGPDQIETYSFATWIKEKIVPRIRAEASFPMLVDVIQKQSNQEFRETMPIESWMKNGTLVHIPQFDKFLTQFVIAAFSNGAPAITEIDYGLDWKSNRLIGPQKRIILPNGDTTIALFSIGKTTGIEVNDLRNQQSYGSRRMRMLAPIEFERLLANKEMTEAEARQTVRALITIESEIDPAEVGYGSTVVVLPRAGSATVTEYQMPLGGGH